MFHILTFCHFIGLFGKSGEGMFNGVKLFLTVRNQKHTPLKKDSSSHLDLFILLKVDVNVFFGEPRDPVMGDGSPTRQSGRHTRGFVPM